MIIALPGLFYNYHVLIYLIGSCVFKFTLTSVLAVGAIVGRSLALGDAFYGVAALGATPPVTIHVE